MQINLNYKVSFLLTKTVIIFLSFGISLLANASEDVARYNSFPKNVIHEEKFVFINGIEQWVTIHGDGSKPVILFLHGGPGSPISPYSASLYKDWEKDFLIVQWDQRGTGKTFGRTAPGELTPEYLKSNPLTVDQMIFDGVELVEYLLKRLEKKKIILFGTSWGSVLGVKLVAKRPDLFYAYVGHSQITDPSDDLKLYEKVYSIAQKSKDTASLDILNSIRKPPYDEARNVGRLMRIVKKYESANSIAAPDSWFVVSAAYDNAKDNQNRSDGDDYSFVNYTGDKKLGVQSMRASINLMKDNLDFKVPVYLIQGEEDLLTTKEATREYFNKISSPKKEYYLLPQTAHGFNLPVLEKQYEVFKSIKTL